MTESILPLFDFPLEEAPKPTVAADYPAAATTADVFLEYHKRNPQVYRTLRSLALDLLRRGITRYGIKGLFEVMRWEYARRTGEDEPLKLNNLFPSYYARMLVANDRRFEDFFTFRRMAADFDPPGICYQCGIIVTLGAPEVSTVCFTCEGE